jgi:poly(A) polymerase
MELLKTTEFDIATGVVRKLQEAGFTAYFAGGAVRDMLLGKNSKDIDIATSATPDVVAMLFPHHHPVGAEFGIIIIVEDGLPFEVATFREERNYNDGRHPEQVSYTDSPQIDAQRRDFTINGMFYDPVNDKVFDWVGGQDDLSQGIIRTIGDAESRFCEDYLRILRAVRFAVRFGFQMESETTAAIIKLKQNVSRLSAERIRNELNLMLAGNAPEQAFRLLFSLGLLDIILPEVALLHGVEQPAEYHPEGDVFEHTMLMLRHIALPTVELGWSILLHDAGKPDTRELGTDGIAHFYCHEEESAKLAESCLRRLKFSRAEITSVVNAVANHMRFAMVERMRPAKIKRLLSEPDFKLQLELHRIDCIACHRKFDCFVCLLDKLYASEGCTALPAPLVTGKDLMALGYKSGPDLGKILREIGELQLAGDINSHSEAIEYARRLLPKS